MKIHHEQLKVGDAVDYPDAEFKIRTAVITRLGQFRKGPANLARKNEAVQWDGDRLVVVTILDDRIQKIHPARKSSSVIRGLLRKGGRYVRMTPRVRRALNAALEGLILSPDQAPTS